MLDAFDTLGLSAPRRVSDRLWLSRLAIGGLHCGACAWLIERAARLVEGWHSARVRMHDHTVEIVFDPAQVQLSEIGRVVGSLGYRLSPLTENAQQRRGQAESRRQLIQIAIAGFCAANAMWIAIGLYAGTFSGIAPGQAQFLRFFGTALGVVAVAGPGRTFFRGAWASLRTRTPHMDLPVALGLGIGSLACLVGLWRGTDDLYFDSLAVLVFLLLIGRWVQFRQQRRAAEAVGLLMRLAPQHATRLDAAGHAQRVRVEDLHSGDRIVVAAGEGLPCDGVIVRGESLLDRSLMTGESVPVAVTIGDRVEAGSANLQSPLELTVEAVGRESRIGQLMQLVEDAALEKSPSVQWADRVGGLFVVVVIGLALVTLIGWTLAADLFVAAQHAVALLIVARPCALALATPLAIAVSLARAARQRLLVRGGDVFERLAGRGIIWFDKTGTLTTGRMELLESASPVSDRALGLAAALEQGSPHPIAQALIAAADRRGLVISAAEQTQQTGGGGVAGIVAGRAVCLGTLRFLTEQGIAVSTTDQQRLEVIAAGSATPLAIAVAGEPLEVAALGDRPREEAAEVLRQLAAAGWRIGVLSGDHQSTVDAIATGLGIAGANALGDLTPEQKLAHIRRSQELEETVVMVGDGVNDAAALAAADVGVAVRGGAEASLAAAPVYLADGKLGGLPRLIDAARRTQRSIRRNFAASLAYNGIAVGLAMAGIINPLVAAILMPISSLTVLSLTLASRTFPPSTPPVAAEGTR
jgi:Cu2+-exporting ATPase